MFFCRGGLRLCMIAHPSTKSNCCFCINSHAVMFYCFIQQTGLTRSLQVYKSYKSGRLNQNSRVIVNLKGKTCYISWHNSLDVPIFVWGPFQFFLKKLDFSLHIFSIVLFFFKSLCYVISHKVTNFLFCDFAHDKDHGTHSPINFKRKYMYMFIAFLLIINQFWNIS